jgi:hypothetical protein
MTNDCCRQAMRGPKTLNKLTYKRHLQSTRDPSRMSPAASAGVHTQSYDAYEMISISQPLEELRIMSTVIPEAFTEGPMMQHFACTTISCAFRRGTREWEVHTTLLT